MTAVWIKEILNDYVPKHTGPIITPEHFLNNFV
jgi:hypothetical protein